MVAPVTPMSSSHIQNGEPSNMSPQLRHKRRRVTPSSADEEGENVDEEGGVVQPHSYYAAAKSPNSLGSSQGSWQGDHPPPLDNDAMRSDSSYRGNWFDAYHRPGGDRDLGAACRLSLDPSNSWSRSGFYDNNEWPNVSYPLTPPQTPRVFYMPL